MGAIHDFRASPLFGTTDRLVLELAEAMTRTPAEIPAELREALLGHLSPAQLTEIVATVAWENHRARLNRALGVRPAGFSDGAYCVVPHRPS